MKNPGGSTLSYTLNDDTINNVEGDKIITCVRVRPLSDIERNSNCNIIMIPEQNEPGLCLIDPLFFSAEKMENIERKAYERHFKYDYFFWSTNNLYNVDFATQERVFEKCAKPLVGHCIAGFNCSILAYGQTGSGKTHTMQGLIFAMRGLFQPNLKMQILAQMQFFSETNHYSRR